MSVDKFGRHSRRAIAGVRGPPGPGFVMTSDGHFDLERKRLKRAHEPEESEDVATKLYVDTQYGEMITNLKKNIRKNLNSVKEELETSISFLHSLVTAKSISLRNDLETFIKDKTDSIEKLLLNTAIDLKNLKISVDNMQTEAEKTKESHRMHLTSLKTHFEELLATKVEIILKQARETKSSNDETNKNILAKLQIYEKALNDVFLNLNIIAKHTSMKKGPVVVPAQK